MKNWTTRMTAAALAAVSAGLLIPALANAAIEFSSVTNHSAGDGPGAVTTLDANGDAIADVAVAGFRLTTSLGEGAGELGLFGEPFPGLLTESSVVAAKLDRGPRDLAVLEDSTDDERVLVLRGRGDGGFRAPRPFSFRQSAYDLGVGDFDGDGKRDLAASSYDENRIAVLFGRGDGTFARARKVRVGNETGDIAVGDLNRDGKDDLAAVDWGGAGISLAYGRANRRFRVAPDVSSGMDAHALAIADVDGDKRPDVAVTNEVPGSDFVSVIWAAKRGFDSPTTVPLGGNTTPQSLALADMNADGLRDLLVGNAGTDAVGLFENAGARSFATAGSVPVGNEPQDVATAKLNDDELPDLITANRVGDSISVLIN